MSQQDAVTQALQVAITCHKQGKSENQAVREARNKFWRSYNTETQAAAERAIRGYYASRAVAVAS